MKRPIAPQWMDAWTPGARYVPSRKQRTCAPHSRRAAASAYLKFFLPLALVATIGICGCGDTNPAAASSGNNPTALVGNFTILSRHDLADLILRGGNSFSIEGNLEVWGNRPLAALSGLENLKSIAGNLVIREKTKLRDLSGLENLKSIGGGLGIYHNTALKSLAGLENLTNIGGSLHIGSNTALSTLSGLENLNNIAGNLHIWHNGALPTLSGLESLNGIGGTLRAMNSRL